MSDDTRGLPPDDFDVDDFGASETEFVELEHELRRKLKIFNEVIWEGRCLAEDIDGWLSNFAGSCQPEEVEHVHALYLLSNLNYFGLREMRVLLTSMYRDLLEYEIVQEIRSGHQNTDLEAINRELRVELRRTRFLGMGNPAESGTHLLYNFRQENNLHKDNFISHHQILNGSARFNQTDFRQPDVERYVFIDDVCVSGQQCVEYGRSMLDDLRHVASARGRTIKFHYLVLFATEQGLERARTLAGFDSAEAVHLIVPSDRCFHLDARIFVDHPDQVDRAVAEDIAEHYGSMLMPGHALGYADSQLLLAFHHNIPDNTLPIMWFDENASWTPIFPRYPKIGA